MKMIAESPVESPLTSEARVRVGLGDRLLCILKQVTYVFQSCNIQILVEIHVEST